MNVKRLLIAIVAVFAFIWATDFLIHSVWLMPDYRATAPLWRPEAEMGHYFVWLLLGQLLWSVTFVTLWAKGFADKARLLCAVMFGLFMGLFFEANTLVAYFSQPLPAGIAAKWFAANVAQAVLAGIIVFYTYKCPPPGEVTNT